MRRYALVLGLGLLLGWSGSALAQRLTVQVPIRVIQTDGTVVDGLRALVLPDNTLAPWELWIQQDVEGGSEALTVAEEGYYHILACGFRQPPPSEPAYLPLVLRKR